MGLSSLCETYDFDISLNRHDNAMDFWKKKYFFVQNWATPGLIFDYFRSFQTIFRIKTAYFRGIRTRIVRVEGEQADHLTTTTVPCKKFFVFKCCCCCFIIKPSASLSTDETKILFFDEPVGATLIRRRRRERYFLKHFSRDNIFPYQDHITKR